MHAALDRVEAAALLEPDALAQSARLAAQLDLGRAARVQCQRS